MKGHPQKAHEFIKDEKRARWHDKSLWFVRTKRDTAVAQIPEWEELRNQGEAIKTYALENLDELLIQFEENCQKNGITVHWAKDGDEHNKIVHGILEKHNAKNIVKSKSMLTEECHLNPYLEERGIEVIDTDLGERIVQLREEPPSHIVMPAIHIKKSEISELFHEKMGTEEGNEDPIYLTRAARADLRKKFIQADAGLTGVNFALADTGAIVVCTNEGNADLGTTLPKVHIASMGMEKIIPRAERLGVFTRLLARSATGQPITTYTSHFKKPAPGQEMHIVIVDNGRSHHLGQEKYRKSMGCIRCGACMNTCPIYRRSGGHSYDFTTPGPIGSVLSPSRDKEKFSTLPFASTLCGSCTDVCPVKINLHEQLLYWRQDIAEAGHIDKIKALSMKGASMVFNSPLLYKVTGAAAKIALKGPKILLPPDAKIWLNQRDLPEVPKKTFKQMMKSRKKGK